MMRIVFVLLLLLVAVIVSAETLVTSAKVLEIGEGRLVLTVGTEPLAVEVLPETKWWHSMSPSSKVEFKVGDVVHVRIKTDSDPPILREIADSATWKWLDSIRKGVMKATVEKLDSRMLYVRFADGTRFSYRITEKSDISLAGKAKAGITDLAAGMTIYVKGRLLPTLDTWVDEITSVAPAGKPVTDPKTGASNSASSAKIKPIKLPATGRLEAEIMTETPTLKMFDVLVDDVRTYHISYNQDTKYFLDGKLADRSVLAKKSKCFVTYKRDQYGRLNASKVEVVSKNL
jgi:hypothetical protein